MMKDKKLTFWIKIVLLYAPFFILLLILRTRGGYDWEQYMWKDWSLFDLKNGIADIYNSWTDCLPIYHLITFFINRISGGAVNFETNLFALRSVSLCFELGSTLILFSLLNNKWHKWYKAVLYSLFYFLNVAVIYNSLVWGQLDVAMTFFLFAAVICGYKKNWLPAFILYLLAVNFKLEALIFLPLMLLIFLPMIRQSKSYKRLFLNFLTVMAVNFIFYLPFLLSNEFPGVWNSIVDSFNTDSFVSKGAFNIWYLLFHKNPMEFSVYVKFLGVSYKVWGWLLFGISSLILLIFLFKKNARSHSTTRKYMLTRKDAFAAFSLITLLFFFLNTEMSGRDLHPAFMFLAGYSMVYRKPWPFILISIAYFLNMESLFHFMKAHNYHTMIYMPWFAAVLYLSAILLLSADLFLAKTRKRYKKMSVGIL